ncbi:hypothetical protein SH449x_001744 [Pirellulaceae bacterium SH449]
MACLINEQIKLLRYRASKHWSDDVRRLTGETLDNGVTESRTYSTDNLLTGISYGKTGTSIGSQGYNCDVNNSETSETIGGTMSGYGFTSAGTSYFDERRAQGSGNRRYDPTLPSQPTVLHHRYDHVHRIRDNTSQ